MTGYRVLEAGDDVGDAEHDAARVAGEARAGAELLLRHVGQEPEVLACNRILFILIPDFIMTLL